jgi:hypothetical protein
LIRGVTSRGMGIIAWGKKWNAPLIFPLFCPLYFLGIDLRSERPVADRTKSRSWKVVLVPMGILAGLCCAAALLLPPIRTRNDPARGVPFSAALASLSAVAPSPLQITPTEGKAAQWRSDTILTTAMSFSVSVADLESIASAFSLERRNDRDSLDTELVCPELKEGRDKQPSWFGEWEGVEPIAIACEETGGNGYALYLLGVGDSNGGVRVFLKLDTWPKPWGTKEARKSYFWLSPQNSTPGNQDY